MYLELAHTKLEVYRSSKQLTLLCYQVTREFPPEEKYNMTQQIRRAALSVHLNIAEGASRHSKQERMRFYEIARGSLIEIDSAIDIAETLGYCSPSHTKELGAVMIRNFRQLSGMIKPDTERSNPIS